MTGEKVTLKPCPFCGAECTEVLAVEIDMYAGMCRACGARGPVRVLGPKQLVEFVKQQAAADWGLAEAPPAVDVAWCLAQMIKQDEIIAGLIKAFPTPAERPDPGHPTGETITEPPGGESGSEPESNETNGTGKAVPLAAEKPVLDEPGNVPAQAIATPPAGEGGEGDSQPNTSEKAPIEPAASQPGSTTRAAEMAASLNGGPKAVKSDSVTQQAPEPPDDGGGDGAGLNADGSVNQCDVRQRLEVLLESVGLTIDAALAKGMKLGASKATLYRLQSGDRIFENTARKISEALGKIERGRKLSGAGVESTTAKPSQLLGSYDESKIQKLPNSFREPTGVNRAPAPQAPPRCSATP